MTSASSRTIIQAPADAIWHVIGDFGAAGRYLDGVVNCTVEGEGVGAVRSLTSVDGSTIVERLETLDAAAQRLSYALLTDTPFGNCLTTMALSPLGPNQTELAWSATFEANGLPADEALEMLEGALNLDSRALQRFLAGGAT